MKWQSCQGETLVLLVHEDRLSLADVAGIISQTLLYGGAPTAAPHAADRQTGGGSVHLPPRRPAQRYDWCPQSPRITLAASLCFSLTPQFICLTLSWPLIVLSNGGQGDNLVPPYTRCCVPLSMSSLRRPNMLHLHLHRTLQASCTGT
jgi:hypothetical protein